MHQIIQCVPNISEGRDLEKVEKVLSAFRGKQGVKLLDYSSDQDHNRTVITVVGEREPLKAAIIEAVGLAVELIDLTVHEGQHPRMGAIDVIPFIPIKNASMDLCVELAKEVAQEIYNLHKMPSFLYEKAATNSQRENLATIRKGQFEGMFEKIKDPSWAPDFGTDIHPTAGIVAVGARMPLVAFNVNLNTDSMEIGDKIAKSVRHLSGGLRFCKALPIELKERGLVQISMNMTDFTKTPLYRALELIRIEANRYGVGIVGSEVVGLVPMDAMLATAEYYMGIENFSYDQVLEKRIME